MKREVRERATDSSYNLCPWPGKKKGKVTPGQRTENKNPNVGTLGHILVAEEFQRWILREQISTAVRNLRKWKRKSFLTA
jgi:hypothetical protein